MAPNIVHGFVVDTGDAIKRACTPQEKCSELLGPKLELDGLAPRAALLLLKVATGVEFRVLAC
jgi:hypothetical protein